MGRKKQPVAVLKAGKSKHYSKADLKIREEKEPKAPEGTISTPQYLVNTDLQPEFETLAPILQGMGVLADIDGDCLARYLVARQTYNKATEQLKSALENGEADEAEKWSKMQDRFFKQARAAAADIGLTVSARANIVLPDKQGEEPEDEEELDLFG